MAEKSTIRLSQSTFYTNLKRSFSSYQFNFLELLATKNTYFNRLLMSWRKPVFLNEIKMADVSNKDNILFIGSGIFPSEPLLIAKETNANVLAIENNARVYKQAKKYLAKQNLSNLIQLELGDGIAYPLNNFNKIFIAINVWPIDGVLIHIAAHGKKNTTIMCKSMNQDILSILEKHNLQDKFKIVNKIDNPRTHSFLLKRN